MKKIRRNSAMLPTTNETPISCGDKKNAVLDKNQSAEIRLDTSNAWMYEFPRSLRIQLAKHTCMNRGRKVSKGVDTSNACVYEFPRSRGYKLAKHTRTYRGQKTVQGLNFHDCIMCIRILCIRKLKKHPQRRDGIVITPCAQDYLEFQNCCEKAISCS